MISERLKGMVGKELPSLTQTTQIERRLVENFIWATEDPNSMWQGEEYAEKAKKYKGVMAPPSIIWTAGVSYKGRLVWPLPDLPFGGVDAGGECEVFKPVRVGESMLRTYRKPKNWNLAWGSAIGLGLRTSKFMSRWKPITKKVVVAK